jgi:hypothetical protein
MTICLNWRHVKAPSLKFDEPRKGVGCSDGWMDVSNRDRRRTVILDSGGIWPAGSQDGNIHPSGPNKKLLS